MKTSSKKWQKIRKIKGLRQFVTWYPRHVSENPGYMSKRDNITKKYMSDPHRFADFFNGYIYNGKEPCGKKIPGHIKESCSYEVGQSILFVSWYRKPN